MSQSTPRALGHYSLVAFTDAYWALPAEEKAAFHRSWLEALRGAARTVDIYQVFPTEHEADVCVWCNVEADEPEAGAVFFEALARAMNPFRRYIRLTTTLWGYTRRSQYSKAARSAQDMDPFAESRRRYLVIYPFVKTAEWYALPSEERQRMMNEHIRIGKQYPEIAQLLLYSFGVQDQEFVVVYEMQDLQRFSELVAELRGAEGRIHTTRDTPLHAAIWNSPEDTLAIFR